MKSLDKKKPKELEWEKEFDKKWEEFVNVGGKRPIKDFIKFLLTQQRSELLEEILEHNKDPMTGLYDYDGIAEEVISLVKK